MKRVKREYIWISLLFIAIALLIPLCVYVATTKYWGFVNLNGMNEMGDAIGGTTAPFIGLLTGFLTFIAFWVQFKFNKNQMDYIELQSVEAKINSLNHTFDIIVRTAPKPLPSDVIIDEQIRCYSIYLEAIFKVDPHPSVSSVKEIICNQKLINDYNIHNNDGLLLTSVGPVYNYLYSYARFIMSLQISHLNKIKNESKKDIISDYILKINSIIKPEYLQLFPLILILSCKKSNIDLNNMLSAKYEDTEAILKGIAEITV